MANNTKEDLQQNYQPQIRVLANGHIQVDTDLTVEDICELPKHLLSVTSDMYRGTITEDGRTGMNEICHLLKSLLPNHLQLKNGLQP